MVNIRKSFVDILGSYFLKNLVPFCRSFHFLLCLFFLASCSVQTITDTSRPFAPSLNERQKYLHLLNRLTFGPRPGDMARLERIGINAFIEEQLHPSNIDDNDLDWKLLSYPTLKMSAVELYEKFPRNLQKDKKKNKRRQIIKELSEAKMIRIISSKRQLYEIMVDFWFNHFNIYANKGLVKWLTTPYEREVIRPHALGRFRDLLGAVAKSPAMLSYLDNATSSVDPRYVPDHLREILEKREKRRMLQNKKGKKRGLNENYARELLELHTLGVDGGYTQQDVIEVARALTGWSIKYPKKNRKNDGIVFTFRNRMHDPGRKTVLGHTIGPDQGVKEGEVILDILARHPSTANFIATKLCRRFVSDDPPPQLVENVARRFLATDGDIRETLREIFYSYQFFEPHHFRSKVKSPLEFIASAVRATNTNMTKPAFFTKAVRKMGQPLYLAKPPTGYPDRSEAWVNAGALLNRMNFALALTRSGKKSRMKLESFIGTTPRSNGELILDRLFSAFLGGEVSEATRRVLKEKLNDPEISQSRLDDPRQEFSLPKLAALVIGSPDFQRK